MKPKTLLINGRKVSYFDEGSGSPILLIHGGGACKEEFIPLIKILKKKYRLIAPDFPGYGDSEELDGEHNIENYLKFLITFTEELELDRFHIMGTSLGGTLALLYTIHNKNAVDKLIVQAPLYHWKQLSTSLPFAKVLLHPRLKFLIRFLSGFRFIQNHYYESYRKQAKDKKIPTIIQHTEKNHIREVESVINIILDRYEKRTSKRVLFEIVISLLNVDLIEKVHEIQSETLITWGIEDDILDRKWGLNLKELIPNSKYVEIENATHFVVIEKYDEISNEIQEFLSE